MMSQRMPRRIKGLQDCATGWKRITETARQLKFQKELRAPQYKRIKAAVALHGKIGLGERARKQQLFLDRVLEISHVYFLLCAIALSQNQVTSTRGTVLDSLIDKIASNKASDSILCPDYQAYAVQLGVPGAVQPSKQYAPQAMLQECSQGGITRSETGELHEDVESRSPNTNSRAEGSDKVLENAHENSDEAGAIRARKMRVAVMPDLQKLQEILGPLLYDGMLTSSVKLAEEKEDREENRIPRSVTGAMRLYFADQEGEDFKLEVSLGYEMGLRVWFEAYPQV